MNEIPAGRDPVAPADDKAAVITESPPGVNIPTARRRHTGTEFRDGNSSEERVQAGDGPNRENKPYTSQLARDSSRRPENTQPDHPTDRRGYSKGHTEDLQ